MLLLYQLPRGYIRSWWEEYPHVLYSWARSAWHNYLACSIRWLETEGVEEAGIVAVGSQAGRSVVTPVLRPVQLLSVTHCRPPLAS